MWITPPPGLLHPLVAGISGGVAHAIFGPDHVAALVTLSTFKGAKAFWVGIRWALGHLLGFCLVAAVTLGIRALGWPNALHVYSEYSEVLAGLSLTAFGCYYYLKRRDYFDEDWKPLTAGCSCAVKAAAAQRAADVEKACDENTPLGNSAKASGHKGYDFGGHDVPRPHGHSNARGDVTLDTPLATLMGFVQGVACPTVVIAVLMLNHYTPEQAVAFFFTFSISTTVAMGGLAAGFGYMTEHFVGSRKLAAAIYCGTCAVAVIVGMLLLFVVISEIWGEGHGGHSHHGHDHGEMHHSHGMQIVDTLMR